MLKLLLKHTILDKCIDTVFDRLITGFTQNPLSNSDVVIGYELNEFGEYRITATWNGKIIKTIYTPELITDLRVVHGSDIYKLLSEAIMYEMYSNVGFMPRGVKW